MKNYLSTIPQTLQNIVANFIGRFWISIIGLIAIPVMVNGLGNELFGIYSFINIVFVYLTVFDLGISKGIIKFLSESISLKQAGRQKQIIYTVLVVYILLGILLLVLVYFFSDLLIAHFLKVEIPEDDGYIQLCIFIMSLSVAFLIIRSAFNGVLVANHKFVLLNTINSVLESLKWLLIIVFVYLGYSIMAIFIIQLFIVLSQTLFLAYYSLKFLPKISIENHFSFSLAKEIFNYSWPVSLSDLISKFIVHVDKIIFTLFNPIASLTYYVVSFQLASKVWEIPSNFLAVFFPKFAQDFANNERQMVVEKYYQVSRIITISVLPILLIMAFWGKLILSLWVNEEVAQSAYIILAIFSTGVFLGCLALPAIYLANALGWVKIPLKVYVSMAITNIALCFILIPKYGLTGAAISWAVSHVLEIFFMIPMVNKKMEINTLEYYRKTVLKPLLITVILFSILFIIGNNFSANLLNWIVWLIIFIISYILVVYNILLIDEERNLLRTLAGR